MIQQIVECVPNFSEGRDKATVDAIVEAVLSVPGATVLDRTSDADHNRSVITFAGAPQAVAEAAVRAVGKAVSRIDLNQHQGVHPRVGAADVVPFVPVDGVTLEDCVRLAESAGEEIWRRFRVPVYYYEAAARRPDRVRLEEIRRGQFERLREEVLRDHQRRPDVGGPELHPTAGATVVGARKFLIAFNVNLETADVARAQRIARKVRESSGGLPFVKAMGVALASRGLAQVSMNLTDFEQTPLDRVFEAVRLEAEREGAAVLESEIVGLIPRRALDSVAARSLRCANFHAELMLEARLTEAADRQAAAASIEVAALASQLREAILTLGMTSAAELAEAALARAIAFARAQVGRIADAAVRSEMEERLRTIQ